MATGLLCASVGAGFEVDELYAQDQERRLARPPCERDGPPSTRTTAKRIGPKSRVSKCRESPRLFLAAVERAGLKHYTWHCNRHTFASRLVMTGVDLHTVGEPLGHPESIDDQTLCASQRASHAGSTGSALLRYNVPPKLCGAETRTQVGLISCCNQKRRGGRARLNAPDSKSDFGPSAPYRIFPHRAAYPQ